MGKPDPSDGEKMLFESSLAEFITRLMDDLDRLRQLLDDYKLSLNLSGPQTEATVIAYGAAEQQWQACAANARVIMIAVAHLNCQTDLEPLVRIESGGDLHALGNAIGPAKSLLLRLFGFVKSRPAATSTAPPAAETPKNRPRPSERVSVAMAQYLDAISDNKDLQNASDRVIYRKVSETVKGLPEIGTWCRYVRDGRRLARPD